MNQKIFPALSVVLDTDAILEQIISLYDIENPKGCYFYQKGCRDKYVIETERNKYNLFVYRQNLRSEDSLISELKVVSYLQLHGIPTYSTVQKKDGSLITRIHTPAGQLLLVLYEESRAEHFSEFTVNVSKLYGQTAGKMHGLLDELQSVEPLKDVQNLDFTMLFTKPLSAMEPFLNKEEYNYLAGLGQHVIRLVQKILPKQRPVYGLCNGNLQPWPFFDKMDKLVFSDFNWLANNWRAYELSTYLWAINLLVDYNNWNEEVIAKRDKIWKAFLEGYAESRQLSEDELLAIKAFVPLNVVRRIGYHLTDKYGTVGWDPLSKEYVAGKVRFIKELVKNYQVGDGNE